MRARSSPGSRLASRWGGAIALAAALGALGAGCNQILGVVPGEPAAGGSGGSPTGGTGGAMGCGPGAAPEAKGTPYLERIPKSEGSDDGRGIAVDADGNVIVVGGFNEFGLDFG